MMEENQIPDLYEREEQCQKAMKVAGKAIFMRLVITGLILWVIFCFPMELWARGLMGLVILINLTGMLPLISEWKRQRAVLRDLIAQEEE